MNRWQSEWAVQNLTNSRLYNLDKSYNASSVWQGFWEAAHQNFEAVNAMTTECDSRRGWQR